MTKTMLTADTITTTRTVLDDVADRAYEITLSENLVQQINARAVNATTRPIATEGLHLTYDDVDYLGEEAVDWLCSRFGCTLETEASGWYLRPEAH